MFEDKNYNSIKDEILNSYNLDLAKNEGSFLNDIASSTAITHASLYSILDKLLNIAFITDTYEDNLDKRVKEYGVERKKGSLARGYVQVLGKEGTTLVDGMQIGANGLIYEYSQAGDTPVRLEEADGEGSALIYISAVLPGSKYNMPKNTYFNPIENIEGISTIYNSEDIVGGVDEETDEELKERFFYLQAHKGTSGNVDDYIKWALEVEGVKNVKVIPLWNGNGTVKVIVMTKDNRNVSEDIVNATKDYIGIKKPIGANVTVVTPNVLDINISATVEAKENFTIEQIESDLKHIVDNYLVNSISEITYTKIAGLLSSVEGVVDYSNLTVNGSNKNIKLISDQVGSVGSISLTKGVVD